MFHAKRFGVHSVVSELLFGSFLVGLFVVAYLIQPVHVLAAWFGFFVSAYSVIANDSIQTIGTFLSSNRQLRWWVLWLYVSLIFFVTLLYSWVLFDGDVSHQRLLAKGFDTPPDRLEYLQLIAPVILLGLTRAKIPVSTSFLVLGTFVGSSSAMRDLTFGSASSFVRLRVSSDEARGSDVPEEVEPLPRVAARRRSISATLASTSAVGEARAASASIALMSFGMRASRARRVTKVGSWPSSLEEWAHASLGEHLKVRSP